MDDFICTRCNIPYSECECEDGVRYEVEPYDCPGTYIYVKNGEYDGSDFDEEDYWS